MHVKICGITKVDQAIAISNLGATALGFICVPGTPRYIAPENIRKITDQLPETIDRVGVFLDASIEEIKRTVAIANLNIVQLHGNESTLFCDELRCALPNIKIIKVFRIWSAEDLDRLPIYEIWVDAFLLDAYHPQQAGGTGQTLDWMMLKQLNPGRPWFLAGGLNPENILEAIAIASPDGIDLSSGLENAPGDKNLERVTKLFEQLKALSTQHSALSTLSLTKTKAGDE